MAKPPSSDKTKSKMQAKDVFGLRKPINLLIVGETRCGKSATGNNILQKTAFESKSGKNAVSKEVQSGCSEIDGRLIQVTEVPGLGCLTRDSVTVTSTRRVANEVEKAVVQNPEGFHAILLVVRYEGPDTDENVKFMNTMRDILGDTSLEYHGILVVTWGDVFNREKEKGATFQQWCHGEKGRFNYLVQECNGRVVLFDNVTKNEHQRATQRGQLLELVEQVAANGNCYSKKQFDKAKRSQNVGEFHEKVHVELVRLQNQCDRIDLGNPKGESGRMTMLISRFEETEQDIQNYDKGHESLAFLKKCVQSKRKYWEEQFQSALSNHQRKTKEENVKLDVSTPLEQTVLLPQRESDKRKRNQRDNRIHLTEKQVSVRKSPGQHSSRGQGAVMDQIGDNSVRMDTIRAEILQVLQQLKPDDILPSLSILTSKDVENVRKVSEQNGDMQGTVLLIEKLSKHKDWFGSLKCALHKSRASHVPLHKIEKAMDLVREEQQRHMSFIDNLKMQRIQDAQTTENLSKDIKELKKKVDDARGGENEDISISYLVQLLARQTQTAHPKYDEDKEAKIRELFEAYVDPDNALMFFHKYNSKVLTQQDQEIVRGITSMFGRTTGARTLLDLLSHYKNWYTCLLEVLRDEGVKKEHVAVKMEEALAIDQNESANSSLDTKNSKDADTDTADIDENTALMLSLFSETKCPRILLHMGADADAANDGKTALMLAAENNNCDRLKILHQQGAKVDASDADGKTSLMLAALKGNGECLKILLDMGAIVNVVDNNGETALMWAALRGDAKCLKMLLKKGAIVKAADNDGMTALMLAAFKGSGECLKILLDMGANVNAVNTKGMIALMWAAFRGHNECLKILLAKGASVNVADNDGETALMWAAQGGNDESLKILVDKGADVNAVDTYGETAMIQLLARGADVNLINKDGKMASSFAYEKGYSECLRMLVKKGANVNMARDDGFTSLMGAAMNGNAPCLKILLENGADVNFAMKDGKTALMWAVQEGQVDCVKILLENGAEANRSMEDGYSVLMSAAQEGHAECVEILLKSGADINSATKDGHTALKFAAQEGHVHCFFGHKKGAQWNPLKREFSVPDESSPLSGHFA